MTIEKFIDIGEKIDIEFKKSQNELNKDWYEFACSFNNKDGRMFFI